MHDLIDLDRYPLDRPDSADWRALVATCRAELQADGMFNLTGFFKPAAIARAVAALTPRFETDSFIHARQHNIYFRKEVPGLAADHPALKLAETKSHTLCADQIGGVIEQLYDWPEFARFLAAAMDKPVLYTMADPLARINAMYYAEGEGLNWHFDRSEFTTTLLLQKPDAGSVFEYRTNLRSDTDPNYDGVARLLTGQDPDLHRIIPEPGTLNVFRGKNTAHRVTPMQGTKPRIIAVFSYFDRPGVTFSADEQMGFYGRVLQ